MELCEELLDQGLSYVVTIMTTRRHLPEEAKNTEDRQEHSIKLFWSDNVMLVSYNKKRGKDVLLVSTQHREPLVATDAKKKSQK